MAYLCALGNYIDIQRYPLGRGRGLLVGTRVQENLGTFVALPSFTRHCWIDLLPSRSSVLPPTTRPNIRAFTYDVGPTYSPVQMYRSTGLPPTCTTYLYICTLSRRRDCQKCIQQRPQEISLDGSQHARHAFLPPLLYTLSEPIYACSIVAVGDSCGLFLTLQRSNVNHRPPLPIVQWGGPSRGARG